MNIFITAHISYESGNENSMMIYSHVYDNFPDSDSNAKLPFFSWLNRNFPLVLWVFDDGEDAVQTNYCQYVAYTDGNNYILATLQVIEN